MFVVRDVWGFWGGSRMLCFAFLYRLFASCCCLLSVCRCLSCWSRFLSSHSGRGLLFALLMALMAYLACCFSLPLFALFLAALLVIFTSLISCSRGLLLPYGQEAPLFYHPCRFCSRTYRVLFSTYLCSWFSSLQLRSSEAF